MESLSVKTLRLLFDYKNGKLTRRRAKSGNARIGAIGCDNGDGYIRTQIGGKAYYVHRLIFAWCKGRWPVSPLDHINHIRSDNRIENLREVSPAQNSLNRRGPTVLNTSGVRGVHHDKKGKRYVANLCGKHLGSFKTRRQAEIRYKTELKKKDIK